MSKTLMWVLVAGVVLVGGYLAMNGKKDKLAEENKNTDEVAVKEETGKKMAFSEFVKQGGDYKCEVHQSMSDMENSGTVYINGTMLRSENTSIAEGMTVNSTVIFRDGYSYIWSSAMPNMGFKTKVVASAGTPGAAATGTYSWNAEQIGDYNCEPWTVDAAKFTVPTTIKFQEISGTPKPQ